MGERLVEFVLRGMIISWLYFQPPIAQYIRFAVDTFSP